MNHRAIISGTASVFGVFTLFIMSKFPPNERTKADKICNSSALLFLMANTVLFFKSIYM